MKKFLFAFVTLFLTLSCEVQQEEDNLKVMSYNMRYDSPNDGENIWDIRKVATPAMIKEVHPDVFGVQEAMVHQIRYVEENCPEYASIGVGRDDGKEGGEFMSIFYDKSKIKLNEWGTVWLSPTPEKPSRGWDAGCFRTATWAKMEVIPAEGAAERIIREQNRSGSREARKGSITAMVIMTVSLEHNFPFFIITQPKPIKIRITTNTFRLNGKFSISSGICMEKILKNSVSRLSIKSLVRIL